MLMFHCQEELIHLVGKIVLMSSWRPVQLPACAEVLSAAHEPPLRAFYYNRLYPPLFYSCKDGIDTGECLK